jgi:hypothetical protein
MNLRTADRAGAPETSGVVSVPGDQLDSLTTRLRLNGVEWRITLSILISPGPVSARCVATHLKLDYGLVKRVVRDLVAWQILERTADGLQFQPDPACWKRPGIARPDPSQPTVAGNSRGVPRRTLRVGLMAERASELKT